MPNNDNRRSQSLLTIARIGCCALGLVVALSVSASSGWLSGILGLDDRVSVESGVWPWSAIGKVDLPTGEFCTGALIGPRHVLTAAHCLFDHQELAWFTPEEVTFLAGDRDDERTSRVNGVDLVFAVEEARYRDIAIDRPTMNWAILIVEREIGIRPIPWRVIGLDGLLEALEDGKATLARAGFSEDSADRLSAHIGCGVAGTSTANGMILHGCDATSGDAGSPLLLIRPGGDADLLAINVAVQHVDSTSMGVAVPAWAFDAAARDVVVRDELRRALH